MSRDTEAQSLRQPGKQRGPNPAQGCVPRPAPGRDKPTQGQAAGSRAYAQGDLGHRCSLHGDRSSGAATGVWGRGHSGQATPSPRPAPERGPGDRLAATHGLPGAPEEEGASLCWGPQHRPTRPDRSPHTSLRTPGRDRRGSALRTPGHGLQAQLRTTCPAAWGLANPDALLLRTPPGAQPAGSGTSTEAATLAKLRAPGTPEPEPGGPSPGCGGPSAAHTLTPQLLLR